MDEIPIGESPMLGPRAKQTKISQASSEYVEPQLNPTADYNLDGFATTKTTNDAFVEKPMHRI